MAINGGVDRQHVRPPSGVPPMLLGISGDNTYANYQEANRTFWRQTVLPLVNRTARSLSAWLAPAWGEPIALKPDLDAIEALWAGLERASFLTVGMDRWGPSGPTRTLTPTGAPLKVWASRSFMFRAYALN